MNCKVSLKISRKLLPTKPTHDFISKQSEGLQLHMLSLKSNQRYLCTPYLVQGCHQLSSTVSICLSRTNGFSFHGQNRFFLDLTKLCKDVLQ